MSILGPTSNFYFSQRLRLHYVDWGNAKAPALLLVHGGHDHARSWDWVAQALRNDFHILAPDLRGHGESEWAKGSSYPMADSIYDLAQLIEQQRLSPVTIVAHSLGGAISLLYTGAFPATVKRLIVIEGWGWSPQVLATGKPVEDRIGRWVSQLRNLSARAPRKYASLDEATNRMREENPRLTAEQARHLTVYGMNQNEDGTFSWKFDNYNRAMTPYRFTDEEARRLWSRITCPTLLIRGTEGPVSDPAADGSLALMPNASAVNVAGAGHWVHHDRLDEVVKLIRSFTAK